MNIKDKLVTVDILNTVVNSINSSLYELTDTTNNLNIRVSFLEDLQNIESYNDIKSILSAGMEKVFFNIGDQIMTTYTDGNVVYECPWDVVHFADVELEDGTITNGMFLQMHYADPLAVQFDAAEQLVATEQTAQSGMFYYGADGNTISNSYTLLNLVVGEAIPYHRYAYVFKNSIKDTTANIVKHGYNKYSHSAIRQYLNSTGTNWWVAKHVGDTPPSQIGNVAFMSHFPTDFINALSKVKITTALNGIVDNNYIEEVYDKFFLPSLCEQFIYDQTSGNEGDIYEYWEELIGGDVPQPVGSSDANVNRISYSLANKSNAVAIRYRSADIDGIGNVWSATTTGIVDSLSASFNYRSRPVCVITGV